MILEKAALTFLGGVAVLAAANETLDLFEQWGIAQPFATLATLAVAASSATVLWRFGRAVCSILFKAGKAVDHAMDQPERDAQIRGELAALAHEMRDRFDQLEKFLDRRASVRD